MGKDRATKGEVYNDLDSQIVDLFHLLRAPEKAKQLEGLLRLTPFGKEELERAYETTPCKVENCRRLLVRAFQGFGSDSATRGHRTGFRSKRPNSQWGWPASEWVTYPDAIKSFTDRLQGVTIENRDWQKVLQIYGTGPGVLVYLDPPYVMAAQGETGRTSRRGYNFDFTDEQHEQMLSVITADTSGTMYVLSGYGSEMYNDYLGGWASFEKSTHAEGAHARTEVLWVSPGSQKEQHQQELF